MRRGAPVKNSHARSMGSHAGYSTLFFSLVLRHVVIFRQTKRPYDIHFRRLFVFQVVQRSRNIAGETSAMGWKISSIGTLTD